MKNTIRLPKTQKVQEAQKPQKARSLPPCFVALCATMLSLPTLAQKPYHGDGADDVLRFAPLAATYALKAGGVESASSWKRLAANTATSYLLAAGTTWALKHTIHERRPDHTDRRSFPSGHSAMAFAGAVILDKEYRHTSPWISVAGYAVATTVAIDRVARNRHHWQDVAAGAAIGAGATVVGYWIGDKITGQHSRYQVALGPQGVAMVIRLDP